jgi:KDO2-lipid IV(A) lauroyltransferase
MSRILYYLILKPLSFLPLIILYRLSDFLYLLSVLGLAYRKKVVYQNLERTFPDNKKKERIEISKGFYRHFYDLLAESIRMFSMPRKEAIRRFKVTNPEIFTISPLKTKSAVLTGGHYQNWELFALATAPQIPHRLLGIYTPLTNPFLEKKFSESRSKLGLVLVPKKEVKSYFHQYEKHLTVTTFAIDQSPRKSQKVYWTTFLGQQTAVHFGAEKYAKNYNQVVIFGKATKPKRGYYELTFEILEETPQTTSEGMITEKATKKLEEQILESPEFWLWTHKRWKLNPQ